MLKFEKKTINLIYFVVICFLTDVASDEDPQRAYAHHVTIHFTNVGFLFSKSISCSGVLISESWVLTLSSCHEKNYDKIKVKYGNDISLRQATRYGKKIIHYEANDLNIVAKNIALIQIDRIEPSGSVKKIQLLRRSMRQTSPEGWHCYFSGWMGHDSVLLSGILAIGDVYMRGPNVCKSLYGTVLCGNFYLGSETVVNRGSPLIYEEPSNKIRSLIGIYASAFKGVALFVPLIDEENIEWIQNKTGISFD